MKRINILTLVIIISLSICTPVFAKNESVRNKSDDLITHFKGMEGRLHSDGSYQLGRNELILLNRYLDECGEVYNLGDALSYAAPSFYKRLPQNVHNSFKKQFINVNSNITLNSNCYHQPSWISGTSVRIAKDGNGLKGVSSINRPTMTGMPEEYSIYYVINEIYNSNTNERVGYSVNASKSSRVSATTLIEPLTGTYHSYGFFEVPWYCPDCYRWTKMTSSTRTSNFYYVNPYQ